MIFADESLALPDFPYEVSIRTAATHPGLFRLAQPLNSPNNSRYFYYQAFLETEGSNYSHVLLSDLRDVLFQAEPFGNVVDSRLHVATEPVSLGQCAANSAWFRAVYGPEKWEELQSGPVFCSGTTLGEIKTIQRYLEWMCREIALHGLSLDTGASTTIIDQAIHIVYCHGHQAELVVEMTESGAIATLAHVRAFTIDPDGLLLNARGEPYRIVHQYDRIRPLRQIYKEKFGFKDHFDLETSFRHYLSTTFPDKMRNALKAVLNTIGPRF